MNLEESTGLLRKIDDHSARVGVIGMGYVGLPTMVAAAECGFSVTGIDVSESRVEQVNAGKSYIGDVSDSTLARLVREGKISATSDYSAIAGQDIALVCVPTPITASKEPDLGPMEQAIDGLAAQLRPGQLLVLQSTTYPGTTEEFVLPKLLAKGKEVGKDFFLAFALERIDPGNARFVVQNVPKVVGGVTPACTQIASHFFSMFIEEVVPVSSPKVAEMTKLLENTFRSVNIALVNELAMLCRRINVDIWEVIDAASSKPFGFMPFFPGPGVGGHCIPVDPFYLSWKAKEHGFHVNFIQLAAEINDSMPEYTCARISEILAHRGKSLKDARLLALGVTFKENIDDIRNSPAINVIDLLIEGGAQLAYSDQAVPHLNIKGRCYESVDISSDSLSKFDAVILLVNHEYYDMREIVEKSSLVIDTRNSAGFLGAKPNVVSIHTPSLASD